MTSISDLLDYALSRFPCVAIPGIGYFSWEQIPAHLDTKNHVIHPPSKILYLQTQARHGENIWEIIERENLMAKARQKALKKQVSLKINELLNIGKTHLPGIGDIRRLEDGNSVLERIDEDWKRKIKHLLPISLTPIGSRADSLSDIDAYSHKKPSIHTSLTSTQEAKSLDDSMWWKASLLPLLIVVLGAGLLVVGLRSYHLRTQQLIAVRVELHKDTMSTSDLNAEYRSFLTDSIRREGCKIVIGSFGMKHNAERLAQQARAKGYQSDIIDQGAGFRVFVVFDCDVQDLGDYLEKVQEEITPKAWYLIPRIDSKYFTR